MANKWQGNGLAEWQEEQTAFLSVVFSWNLPDAYQRAVWLRTQGLRVRAGGPAVTMNPGYLADVAECGGKVNALPYHNSQATFTSRGCIRRCSFCAVPKIEGDLHELEDHEWEPRPIVCDNNLLACSWSHFAHVIERLYPIKQVDFNQGLDARLLTTEHAQLLATLNLYCIRLAWDNTHDEALFRRAFAMLVKAGIPERKIRVYVLFGFRDTPDDALYRLETIRGLGGLPNPARYQPLDAMRRNEYVAPGWSDAELTRFMRYWYNLRITSKVPFAEFCTTYRKEQPLETLPLFA
jgi:hypothetical protein